MFRFVLAVFFACTMAAAGVAGSINSLLVPGVSNVLSDDSFETIWKPVSDGSGGFTPGVFDVSDIGDLTRVTTVPAVDNEWGERLDLGDRLVATAFIPAWLQGGNSDTFNPFNPNWNEELTLVAVTEVTGKVDNGDGTFDYAFGAPSDVDPLGLGWSSGTAVAFYSDPSNDYFSSTQGNNLWSDIVSASNGTAFWEFGFDPSQGNAYWLAPDVDTDIVTTVGVASGSAGDFNIGLNLIARNGGMGLGEVGSTGLELTGSGNFVSDAVGEWPLSNELRFTISPVPEPGSVAIWSMIGLVGIVGYRNRQRSKS